ncbi:hypothetical protein AKJ09_08674 [Labilithrix luteola]|uniref:Uncharacterized protein n=1 Tax=Labilithrix luteola TaxID=1391654 RepID=A0A0K1Q872_9BACT|nr:hypothetical protein AKJ09_08674 [Labilithrix luteola]
MRVDARGRPTRVHPGSGSKSDWAFPNRTAALTAPLAGHLRFR